MYFDRWLLSSRYNIFMGKTMFIFVSLPNHSLSARTNDLKVSIPFQDRKNGITNLNRIKHVHSKIRNIP